MPTHSKTTIVNAVAGLLGSTERINSLDDSQSKVARAAKALWSDALEPLLADHPWNFALRRAVLNEDGEAPDFGWARRFKLPPECLRWLPPPVGDDDYFEGEREGDYLLSNAEAPLHIRYIAYVDEVPKYSAPFRKALEYALAAEMALDITSSVGLRDRLERASQDWLMKAKRRDGLETGQRRRGSVVARSTWLAARNRSYPQVGR